MENLLEEYVFCLIVESLEFILSRSGKINPETQETYDTATLINIATFKQPDPETKRIEYMRSPIVKALLCLAITHARINLNKRRKIKN